ncbi:MAG: glycosyltransferase family 4 protein, partial [Verrucomicrobiota bacterium]
VVCPSRFVQESLPPGARKKSVIAEFGSPPGRPLKRHHGPRLRILFAGAMSQRKGLADLFAAMKILGRSDVELVVMGSPVVPMDFYRGEYAGFIYEPTRPHDGVLDLMSTCDLLVLPSIVEGRALVQQEALSCGLPLLVTANAGGADLIEEGATGFLIPIRSPAAIAEKIAWFADHRNLLPMMQDAAQRKAGEYTWPDYAGKILQAIRR